MAKPSLSNTSEHGLEHVDWDRVTAHLDAQGFAPLGRILPRETCDEFVRMYEDRERFRKRVLMARHGYGRGEYQYFRYPLPNLLQNLRISLYRHWAPIANRWSARLGQHTSFPADLPSFLEHCHRNNQPEPTPLLLKYQEGDCNRLHQDLYGETYFPIQVAVLLSQPGEDFQGGEFVLTESRPRVQSQAHVVPLSQGEAVVFAVNHRPEAGRRGYRRVQMRHGVSALRSGQRFCLGVIFHDGT